MRRYRWRDASRLLGRTMTIRSDAFALAGEMRSANPARQPKVPVGPPCITG